MRKLIVFFLAFALVSLFSINCIADTNETLRIGVFIPNAGEPYFQNKNHGYYQAEVLLKQYYNINVDVELYDAGGFQHPLNQIKQIEDSLQRGMDAIVLNACDAEALIPVVEEALARGVPVISDDCLVNTETTMKISENSKHVGEVQAQFIVESLGEKGNVVMLLGPPGADISQQRSAGALEYFEKYPGINILDKQWHEPEVYEALKKMEDFIQAYGDDIDAVYTYSSTAGMAAAQTLEAAGYKPGEIVITTIDLDPDVIQYMEEGWISSIIPCQPVKLARSAVFYAVRAALGQEVPKRIYSGDEINLTIDSLKNFDQSDAIAAEYF